jgi:lysophospholipase L1-like esterase
MKRVVLIGDSIRMGYQDGVARELAGEAEVWGPEENCADTRNIVAHVQEWITDQPADVIHINSGLHDVKRVSDPEETEVPLEEYESNVERILTAVLKKGDAQPIWALTTPVNEQWHHKNKTFDRFNEEIHAVNRAARRVCDRLGVPVNDLYAAIQEAGRDALLVEDGVHFTEEGYKVLARAVAAELRRFLA